jgi:DNA-directed RNA polymerase subunit RPC12/RpoP
MTPMPNPNTAGEITGQGRVEALEASIESAAVRIIRNRASDGPSADRAVAHARQFDTDVWRDAKRDARAALSTAPDTAPVEAGGGVIVKQLEWDDATSVLIGPHVYFSRSTTPFSSYRTEQRIAGRWWMTGPDGEALCDDTGAIASFDTLDEAKSAAQADYERRIRSALVTPPPAPLTPSGARLEGAAEVHYERVRLRVGMRPDGTMIMPPWEEVSPANKANQIEDIRAIAASLSPAPTQGVRCTYCGDTGKITDSVDGEITCPECGYASPSPSPASAPSPAGGAVREAEVTRIKDWLLERNREHLYEKGLMMRRHSGDAEMFLDAAILLSQLASLSSPATPEPKTANCCKCGRIIDTREKTEGGDDFGLRADGRPLDLLARMLGGLSPIPTRRPSRYRETGRAFGSFHAQTTRPRRPSPPLRVAGTISRARRRMGRGSSYTDRRLNSAGGSVLSRPAGISLRMAMRRGRGLTKTMISPRQMNGQGRSPSSRTVTTTRRRTASPIGAI